MDAVVSIACSEIVLTIGIGFAVEVGMGHLHIAVGFPFTVTIVHAVVYTCLLLSQLSTVLQSLRIPATCFSWFSITIQIVGCSVGGKARVVAEAEGKESGEPSFIRSTTNLRICQGANTVFLLQLDVHHIAVVAHDMLTKELALVAPLVVNLNVLHGISRQIVEHNGVVTSEEVFSIEQQGIDILAVVVDATSLLQFDTRQLAYQRIKH